MTDHRLPYTDAETLPEMAGDCHEVEHNLHLNPRAVGRYPAEHLGDLPVPQGARIHSRYVVSDDLARMAEGLELHFD